MNHHRTGQTVRSGVTLVEVAVSTVLVGVLLVAALETVGSSVRTNRMASEVLDGYTLAEELMAEILAQPYEDPDGATSGLGVESGEPSSPTDRVAFDDIDDYDGWDSLPPQQRDGSSIAAYAGWRRRVFIRYVQPNPTGTTAGEDFVDGGVKRVNVRVTDPSGDNTNLYAYRSEHGVGSESAPFDAQLAPGLRVSISTGGAEVHTGTTLLNTPEAP